MRDAVRITMREIEDLDTFQIIERLLEFNPGGGYTPRQGRVDLAGTLLRYEHAPLKDDEGWE
jgi:hypothetical protein